MSDCSIRVYEVSKVACGWVMGKQGGVLAVLEPVGICCDDGERPGGMSLITCSHGLPLFSSPI